FVIMMFYVGVSRLNLDHMIVTLPNIWACALDLLESLWLWAPSKGLDIVTADIKTGIFLKKRMQTNEYYNNGKYPQYYPQIFLQTFDL
ncbi:hypothetical protein ACJX0J_022206, partial [Zea mays]